jgi:hypothetical protein
MNNDVVMTEFAQRINAEVIERSHGQVEAEYSDTAPPDFVENAFTQLMFDYLSDNGVIDDAEVCYFQYGTGSEKAKINGYSIDEERRLVNLYISLYYHADTSVNVRKEEVSNSFNQAMQFFFLAIQGHHNSMEPASDQFSMMQRLYEVRKNVDQVRIHLLTNGITAMDSYATGHRDGYIFRFWLWDLRRLFQCIESGLRELIEIDFEERLGKPLPCVATPRFTDDYTAYLTIIPGETLYQLYDEFGSRLLELNVRSFLQATSKVNRGIRETLRTEAHRFLAYNNGISITADSVELLVDSGKGEAIKSIHGLQVVNGGQTMVSIYRAKKNAESALGDVYVPAKITVIDRNKAYEMVPRISRYANTQNRVSEADFSSRDPYHIEIQHLSETLWVPGDQSRWFYERARGTYQETKVRQATSQAKKKQFETVTPASQKFTKTDLAKYINSWDMLPDIVSLGAQKNFIRFMDSLRTQYGTDWKPDADYYKDLVAKAIIFKTVTKIVRQMQIPAYQANVVTYTIAYLAYRAAGRIDLRRIWERQEVPEGINGAIEKWCPDIFDKIVESAGERNVTEWCKKEDCWRVIQGLKLSVPAGLEKEMKGTQPLPTVGRPSARRSEVLATEDRENIARVMNVDAVTWLKIHDWGKRTGLLKDWQYGIALTLCNYAADDWGKVPSAKQAKHGVEILEIASPNMNAES